MLLLAGSDTIYIKIRRNVFTVKHIETGKEVSVEAREPFTSTRLLVGHFKVAEDLLSKAIKKVYKRRSLFGSPRIIIHPLEMIENGLCEVEERAIMELAVGSFNGGGMVLVWIGKELSDKDAQSKAKSI